MKKIFNLGILAFLIVSLGFSSLGFAETSLTSTNNTETQESATTFKQRQENRKKELKIALSTSEKLRIKSRCQAAQGKLSSVSQRAKGIATSRGQVHGNIVDHLESLVTKLKAKSVNTTELETNIAVLKTKITDFNNSLDLYKQAVNDLVVLECQTDPDAFKAALLASRTSLEQVKKDSKSVRDYLKDVIKPLLVSIRTQLEPDSNKEETN